MGLARRGLRRTAGVGPAERRTTGRSRVSGRRGALKQGALAALSGCFDDDKPRAGLGRPACRPPGTTSLGKGRSGRRGREPDPRRLGARQGGAGKSYFHRGCQGSLDGSLGAQLRVARGTTGCCRSEMRGVARSLTGAQRHVPWDRTVRPCRALRAGGGSALGGGDSSVPYAQMVVPGGRRVGRPSPARGISSSKHPGKAARRPRSPCASSSWPGPVVPLTTRPTGDVFTRPRPAAAVAALLGPRTGRFVTLALPLAPRTVPKSPDRALPAARRAALYSPSPPNSHFKPLKRDTESEDFCKTRLTRRGRKWQLVCPKRAYRIAAPR